MDRIEKKEEGLQELSTLEPRTCKANKEYLFLIADIILDKLISYQEHSSSNKEQLDSAIEDLYKLQIEILKIR